MKLKAKKKSRSISDKFLKELKDGHFKPILDYVKSDDTLNMEFRGNNVIIYYRGGKLLTIVEDSSKALESLDENYLKEGKLVTPTIENIEDYIPKAKRVIDRYVVEVENHLWEKEIQQRVVQENNYSKNSSNTDFFIIDTEYQDNTVGGRFDIVALRWESNAQARKLSKNHRPKITIFEVKQGFSSISGTSGLSKHLNDFNAFIADEAKLTAFKQDMIDVFKQKCELGLVSELKNYEKINIETIESNIDFIFILVNYDFESAELTKELTKISNCNFIYASPMGYGLYAQNVINKQEFVECFMAQD